MEPYENLANAIVIRAAEDYRHATRKLTVNPDFLPALRLESDCEQFFISEWFGVLTDLNGAGLLARLKEERE